MIEKGLQHWCTAAHAGLRALYIICNTINTKVGTYIGVSSHSGIVTDTVHSAMIQL